MVAIYVKCGGIFNNHFIVNLLMSLPVGLAVDSYLLCEGTACGLPTAPTNVRYCLL